MVALKMLGITHTLMTTPTIRATTWDRPYKIIFSYFKEPRLTILPPSATFETLMKPHTYKEAGVDITVGNQFVDQIKPLIKKTDRPGVLSSIGGFAGLFSLKKLQIENPILVSTTDGVGTKLKLAIDEKSYLGIGQDLVAMCVNDLLCVGAEPLFFLDYFATGKLNPEIAVEVVKGITQSLQSIQCALLGGETAEMPGLYQNNDFDLAGFTVGVVDESKMIDGTQVKPGQTIIGISSSGVHSNGFSLVRKIIQDKNLKLDQIYSPLEIPLGEALLVPTKIYVNSVLALKKEFPIYGIAHITGGGLLENPPRVFSKSCRALIQKNSWEKLPIFTLLQEAGSLEEEEMLRVFNCGIGLLLIVEKSDTHKIISRLSVLGEKAFEIGEILERTENQASISFVN